jgi:hypothetical protein
MTWQLLALAAIIVATVALLVVWVRLAGRRASGHPLEPTREVGIPPGFGDPLDER